MNDTDPTFIRLLCDIMIPAEFSTAIRANGYDVAEARTLPVEAQQDDWAILAEAMQQQRAVVTCNYSDPQSNFCLIHQAWRNQGKEHILLRRWEVRDRLLDFLNQHTAEELKNELWWLPQG